MLRYVLPVLLILCVLLPLQAQETTPEPVVPETTAEPAVLETTPEPAMLEETGPDPNAPENFRCFTGEDAFLRHIEQGALNRGRQKMRDALNHYNCAIQLKEDAAIAYRGRGIAYAAMGSYQLALADYDIASDINPRDSLIYFQRGLALHQMSEDQAALEALSQSIRLDPGFALAFNWRGIVQRDLGNIEQAMQDFQIAISLGIPDQLYVPYINLGNLYLKQKENPAEAAYWFEEAARLVPGQGFIYELLGDTYFKMGNLQEAERNYELYIQVTNTAKESVRSMVEAAAFRQLLLRYAPTILILFIVGYFALLAGLRWRQTRQALRAAPGSAPVLTPDTVIPGTPVPAPPSPDAALSRPGWLAVLLVPISL